MRSTLHHLLVFVIAAAAAPALKGQDGFSFKSGVDLVNVTATVTDEKGTFVGGLVKEDFRIFDNDKPQPITHFNSERVPVSLGILLDTSGSMTDDKMTAARAAISRFIFELLGPEDELFFVEFNDRVRLMQDWTTDREAINRAVKRASSHGGTVLYDAIAESLPIAAGGKHRKKALLVISDGNDARSEISAFELRQAIRESEILVYALGVDGRDLPTSAFPPQTQPRPPTTFPPSTFPPTFPPTTTPFPIPGTSGRGRTFPQIVIGGGGGAPRQGRARTAPDTRVNADALRQLTDETGGRTEIIRELRDLDGATARIADELSRQYSLAYAAPGERDGRWHSIRVELRDRRLTVRARRGYIAS